MRSLIDNGSSDSVVSQLLFSGIAITCSLLLLILFLHLYIIFCFLRIADPSYRNIRGKSGDEEGGAPALIPVGEANCVVCQSSLAENGGAVEVLPRCRHVFHVSCIGRWLSSYSVRCPLCRTPARGEAPVVSGAVETDGFMGSYVVSEDSPYLSLLFY